MHKEIVTGKTFDYFEQKQPSKGVLSNLFKQK